MTGDGRMITGDSEAAIRSFSGAFTVMPGVTQRQDM